MGRGLDALLKNNTATSATDQGAKEIVGSSVFMLAINSIIANPDQPRVNFEAEPLEELSTSIQNIGIVQPLTVRRLTPGKYQIISGERRFRAAQMAGLTEVPVYVRLADDEQMLEMALVENIQRRDLDPIEVSLSYQRLMEECDLTQEGVADRVGKQRSTVANYIRLSKLSSLIQAGLRDRSISMGHARALLGIKKHSLQDDMYLKALKHEWSVRDLEAAVRQLSMPKSPSRDQVKSSRDDKAAKKISDARGLPTQVTTKEDGSGQVVLKFSSKKELNKLLSELRVKN